MRDKSFVMKRYLMAKKYNFGEKELANVQLEALVMDQTRASPNILDIYGHCGTSVLIEAMSSGISHRIVPGKGVSEQKPLYENGNFHSFNNLTTSEKLEIATSMAESLAALHDFDKGVIVHGDVNIDQWLIDHQGKIKLNDFNLAEILPWNDASKEYGSFKKKYDGAFRLVRSPEEFMGMSSGKEKDMYSYGNIIYSLLTGLWPFYDELARTVDPGKRREAIYNGARPYIDEALSQTTNQVEKQLLHIMKQCWHTDPMKRPSMEDVVDILKRTKT